VPAELKSYNKTNGLLEQEIISLCAASGSGFGFGTGAGAGGKDEVVAEARPSYTRSLFRPRHNLSSSVHLDTSKMLQSKLPQPSQSRR